MKVSSRCLAVVVILLGGFALAQVSVGTPPYGSFGGGPFDTVNLGNLNVHFSIPVLHKAGRGLPFTYDLSYDGSIWYPTVVNGTTQWMPTQNWGWMSNTLAVIGYLSPSTTSSKPIVGKFCPGGQWGSSTTYTTTYAYFDGKNISHPFPGSTQMTVIAGACQRTSYGSPLTAVSTDGSGWTLYAPANQVGTTVTTRSGIIVATNVYNPNSGSGWYQDTNGNQLTVNTNGEYFDTLSSTAAVLSVTGSGTPTSPITYTYAAPSGSPSYTVNYLQYTVATAFGISGIAEYGKTSNALVSSIQLPDGSEYQFEYEQTPGSCTPLANTQPSCVTARLYRVTLPTGGIVTYTYSGGGSGTGIYKDGSSGNLTRQLAHGGTTPNGSWSYTRQLLSGSPAPGSTWKTTVVDAGGNNTVINFAEDGATNSSTTAATYNFYETQRQVYRGSISSNNLLLTTTACYNRNYLGCSAATVSSPITKTDSYAQPAGGQTRLSETAYNSYGLVTDDKEYDYGVAMGGAPGTTHLIRETSITYDTSLGNHIVDRPSLVWVTDWSSGSQVTVTSTSYAWDAGTPTPTSNTPQHTSITGSRGNLTAILSYKNSSSWLQQNITYYDTGEPNVVTDVNNAQTTYVYDQSTSCGNSFPTSIQEPLSLSRSMQWNCTGGVAEQVTDENRNNVTTTYTDPYFWRPNGLTDQMNYSTSITYGINPSTVESKLPFGSSVADSLITVDGFRRATFTQHKQGPSSSNYDTLETDYNSLGQPYISRMPYSATASPTSNNSSAPPTTTTYDALGRVLTIVDSNGGTVSYTYLQNDVLQQVSGSQTFKKQLQFDGLGRLASVCEISTTLPGVGACSQNVSQIGYLTRYTYDAAGHLLTVTQNAQGGTSQTRSFAYDWLGRMTSESNPEAANLAVNYTYDSVSSGNCAGTFSGDLIKRQDAAGNVSCYSYDALHRPTEVTYPSGPNSAATHAKYFWYDSSYNGSQGTNLKGRLVAAITCQTNTSCTGNAVVNENFGYSARGELTDVWETTPNSGGSYHTSASPWAPGSVAALSMPSVPTIYYGGSTGNLLDGEGRYTGVSASSGTGPVSSIGYSTSNTPNPLGALTSLTYGSLDKDTFTYDPNTGRLTQYAFTVGSTPQTMTGSLNWNANGTLNGLAVIDPFNSNDTQTCSYSHDDVGRIAGVGCGGDAGLANPGFESGNTGWNLGSGWSIVNNASNAQAGSWYLSGSTTSMDDQTTATNGSGNAWSPVTPGTTVHIGGWINRVSGTGNIWWNCEFVDSNYNVLAWCQDAGLGNGTDGAGWNFYESSSTAPVNAAYVRFYAEIHGGNDPNNSLTTGYFDTATFSTSASLWSQTFSYDPFGNLTKSGSVAWQPGYNESTNRYTLSGTSYDGNGNLLTDPLNTYAWDANGSLVSVNGTSILYDAFGRMVEKNGTYQFVYSPVGASTLAIMQGQSLNTAYIGLPAGAFAIYNASGLTQYNHPDWLGSARLFSTPNRNTTPGLAYAPFGEGYSVASAWIQFTSNGNSWTVNDNGNNQTGTLDDFLFRRYSPGQGRWISPDPAGLAAVDPSTPQTWNRYAYVANNPLSYVDPLGLQLCHNPCSPGTPGGGDPNNPFDPTGDGSVWGSALSETLTYQWVSGDPASGPWIYGIDNQGNPIYGFTVGAGYWQLSDVSFSSSGPVTSTSHASGGISAANNGWSLFGWDKNAWKTFFKEAVQPWKDTCAQTFAKAFAEGGVVSAVSNNLEGGPDPDQVIKEAGGMVAAQYVVNNGLAVPLRSSIYRGILSGTETAATGFVLLDAYTRIGQGLYEEGKSYLAGECR